MFSGRQPVTKDKDGCYFLDTEGEVFQHIMNFLRTEEMPPGSMSERGKHCASYFGIQTLVDALNQVDVSTGLEVLKLEYSLRLKIKRNDWLHADTCPQSANHCPLFLV